MITNTKQYLLDEVGFDTPEFEPSNVCSKGLTCDNYNTYVPYSPFVPGILIHSPAGKQTAEPVARTLQQTLDAAHLSGFFDVDFEAVAADIAEVVEFFEQMKQASVDNVRTKQAKQAAKLRAAAAFNRTAAGEML